MPDNMGGIVTAAFTTQQNIALYAQNNHTALVTLRPGAEWLPLMLRLNGANITVKHEQSEAGALYKITGSLILLKECAALPVLRINRLLLICIQLADGTYRLLGTDEYPLVCTLSPLTPGNASGFVGYELEINGIQLDEPPLITI